MMKQHAAQPDYTAEIRAILQSSLPPKAMGERLSDYHANDLAGAVDAIGDVERKRLLLVLEPEVLAGVLDYLDDGKRAERYLNELELKKRAATLREMDADLLVELLRCASPRDRADLLDLMDEAVKKEIALIDSFPEEEIGSRMSTNFVAVHEEFTIKQAMKSVVEQAAEHDNLSTIFVLDDEGCYCGAMDLKDLIVARESVELDSLVVASFPYVYGWEPVDTCMEKLKDYSEASIPVLDSTNRLLGVLTSQSMIALVDEEMGEDYAKLAGLAAEEDLEEPIGESVKKRLPWLIVLLGLGLVVSSVVGVFEGVVEQLTLIICFQSLILDMAGNVGTQSLAVTIRVLMNEHLTGRQKAELVVKEMRVGFANGIFLSALSFLLIGGYVCIFKGQAVLTAFAISGCIGVSLLVAMVISSLVGTAVPMFFKRIHIDPAVASGPLITTVNDLVAVVTYYGLTWLLLLQLLHLGN